MLHIYNSSAARAKAASVSYTHLDVYKRQALNAAKGGAARVTAADISAEAIAMAKRNAEPVSYTHLDVYKRQCGMCKAPGIWVHRMWSFCRAQKTP